MQKLNNSSAKEPISTQNAKKNVTWMLGTIKSRTPVNCQRQMQAPQCQSSKKLLQQLINELPFDDTLDELKISRFPFNKGREYLTITELSQC
jgi:hypothetical protein